MLMLNSHSVALVFSTSWNQRASLAVLYMDVIRG